MKILVRLYAGLKANLPPGAQGHQTELELERPATVGQAIDALKIPPAQTKLILINGRQAAEEAALKEGDLLVIFPPVGGG